MAGYLPPNPHPKKKRPTWETHDWSVALCNASYAQDGFHLVPLLVLLCSWSSVGKYCCITAALLGSLRLTSRDLLNFFRFWLTDVDGINTLKVLLRPSHRKEPRWPSELGNETRCQILSHRWLRPSHKPCNSLLFDTFPILLDLRPIQELSLLLDNSPLLLL